MDFLMDATDYYKGAAQSNPMKTSASEPVLSFWYGDVLNTPRFLAYQKACAALLRCAECHKYLNERQPMEDTLKEAEDLFDEYQERARSAIKLLNTAKTGGFITAVGPGAAAAGWMLGGVLGTIGLGVAAGAVTGGIAIPAAGYLGYKLLNNLHTYRRVSQNLPESGDPLWELQKQATMFNNALIFLRQGPALPTPPSG
jgi:hypothetical protein